MFATRRPYASVAIALSVLFAGVPSARAQTGFYTPEQVIKITPEWKGERFPDGRPKVSDSILDRMKKVTLEEAWATIKVGNFNNQMEDGWFIIHPGQVMVGRALTTMWMPGRPDIQKVIEDDQKGHRKGAMNAWPVDMLQRVTCTWPITSA